MTMQAQLLLVDDDEANREVLRRRLLRAGYEVDTAEDGAEALAAVRSRPYDLVLLDNMMPGLSGPQVLQRIRETWSTSELPVIMVTALDDGEHVVNALREGANDYLTKPLDFPVALARIESHLRVALSAREARRTHELYQLASRASEEGLWEWDPAADKVQCSMAWVAGLGYPEAEATCTLGAWLERVHPEDRGCLRQQLESCLNDNNPLDAEYRVRRQDGRYRWAEIRCRLLRTSGGESARVSGYQVDITARKTVDPLTGLPNRLWLSGEVGELAGEGQRPALLLVNVDGFDRMEQSLRSGGSGRLLTAIAERLRWYWRETPKAGGTGLARTGEHQFGVLLRHVSGPVEAQQLADGMCCALRRPINIDGDEVFATASVGIALISSPASVEEAFRSAAAALRRAGDLGGGRSELFHETLRLQEIEETRLENDLRRALDRDQFEVYYQPKVHLFHGAITGVEALVRWNRPGHGVVRPDVFIPLAERTGLVVALGKWVLEQSCRDTAELRRIYPELGVSVNVSGRQLAEPDLVEQIAASLENAGLEPSALRVEITETCLVDDPETALSRIGRIRSMGVGVKLDDFGSGYASFDYLQRFPFDSIKIDRSFVARLHCSRESDEIVRAIVGLARSLQMSVIAEGIETHEQLVWLRQLGCTYGQGYLLSPPLTLAQLTRLLEDSQGRLCAGIPPEESPGLDGTGAAFPSPVLAGEIRTRKL